MTTATAFGLPENTQEIVCLSCSFFYFFYFFYGPVSISGAIQTDLPSYLLLSIYGTRTQPVLLWSQRWHTGWSKAAICLPGELGTEGGKGAGRGSGVTGAALQTCSMPVRWLGWDLVVWTAFGQQPSIYKTHPKWQDGSAARPARHRPTYCIA